MLSPVLSAVAFRSFNFCSVVMISRCNSRYCCSDTSPFSNCACTCFSASFSTSSLFAVSCILSLSICCFCASSSVFVGSSSSSLFTVLSSFCKFTLSPLASERALDSFVVFPPISMVIPFMLLLPAIFIPLFSALVSFF